MYIRSAPCPPRQAGISCFTSSFPSQYQSEASSLFHSQSIPLSLSLSSKPKSYWCNSDHMSMKMWELTPFLGDGSKINGRLIVVSHISVDKCWYLLKRKCPWGLMEIRLVKIPGAVREPDPELKLVLPQSWLMFFKKIELWMPRKKLAKTVEIFVEIDHVKNQEVTFWPEIIGPVFPMLWSGHEFSHKTLTELMTAP